MGWRNKQISYFESALRETSVFVSAISRIRSGIYWKESEDSFNLKLSFLALRIKYKNSQLFVMQTFSVIRQRYLDGSTWLVKVLIAGGCRRMGRWKGERGCVRGRLRVMLRRKSCGRRWRRSGRHADRHAGDRNAHCDAPISGAAAVLDTRKHKTNSHK